MSLKAIILDVDGTLAETEEGHRAAFNAAFAEAGHDWRWDETLYGKLLRVAGGKERLAHYAAQGGIDLDADAVAALHRRKTALYLDHVAAGRMTLRPGVAELITEAQTAGVKLAIATTTTRGNVDALLDRALGEGTTARFAAIGAGDAVAAKKPAPDVYLAVLDMLGLAAGDCVAIEDSPDGLAAARAAGIATVVTPSRYMAGSDFAGALVVAPSLAALTSAVQPSVLNALRGLLGPA